MNPLKAVRQYCLDCSGDSPSEVKDCVITDCPLYQFRMGTNPTRKPRVLSDKSREALSKASKARSLRYKRGFEPEAPPDDQTPV